MQTIGPHYSLIQVGVDNLRRCITTKDERVCPRCKLTAINIGLVDTEEQYKRLSCMCVMRPLKPQGNFFMDWYPTRALSITRLLLLSQNVAAPQNIGCWCSHHSSLVEISLLNLKAELDKLSLL